MGWRDEVKPTFAADKARCDALARAAQADHQRRAANRDAAKQLLDGPVIHGVALYNDAVEATGGGASMQGPILGQADSYVLKLAMNRPHRPPLLLAIEAGVRPEGLVVTYERARESEGLVVTYDLTGRPAPRAFAPTADAVTPELVAQTLWDLYKTSLEHDAPIISG